MSVETVAAVLLAFFGGTAILVVLALTHDLLVGWLQFLSGRLVAAARLVWGQFPPAMTRLAGAVGLSLGRVKAFGPESLPLAIVETVIGFAAFLVLLRVEFDLITLRIAAALGILVEEPPASLHELGGLAWVVTTLVHAGLLVSLLGGVAVGPWHRFRRAARGAVLAAAAVMLAASLAASGVLMYWAMAMTEADQMLWLAQTFMIAFAVLAAAALVVLAWTVPAAGLLGGAVALGLARVGLGAARIVAGGVLLGLAAVPATAAIAVAVARTLVETPWNWWTTTFVWPQNHGCEPLDPTRESATAPGPATPSNDLDEIENADKELEIMADLHRTVASVALGETPAHLYDMTRKTSGHGGLHRELAADLVLRSLEVPQGRPRVPGIVSCDLEPSELRWLVGRSASRAEAEDRAATAGLDRLTAALVSREMASGNLLVGVELSRLTPAVVAKLAEFKQHRPAVRTTVLAYMPAAIDLGAAAGAGWSALQALHRSRVVDGVLLLEPRGALADTRSTAYAEQSIALILRTLLARGAEQTRPLESAVLPLAMEHPFLAVRTLSRPVAEAGRRGRFPRAGARPVDADAVFVQARNATAELVAGVDDGVIGVDAAVNPDRPFAVVYVVPSPGSKTALADLTARLARELNERYGTRATPIFVQGEGIAHPDHLAGKRWLQVALVAPAVGVPAVLQPYVQPLTIDAVTVAAPHHNGAVVATTAAA